MRPFYLVIGAVLAFNTVLLGFLAWAYRSPRFESRRILLGVAMKVPARERAMNMAVSGVLSLVAVLGSTYLLFSSLFRSDLALFATDGSALGAVGRVALESAGILLVYDFTYYVLHRTMHHKQLMRWVHGVHHRARNPSALESFYLHPIELLAGLGLLIASTWVVGPVRMESFLVAFFVYSNLNIVIHSGLRFGHPLLAVIDFLTQKHHVHHRNDFSKNFASLTPLPDLLFRTSG